MRYLLLVLIFLSFDSIGQTIDQGYQVIQSAKSNSSLDDIGFLKDYLENVKLIGMGESTHGTSEFFTMRHKVFRYLVLNHGFNTFFLEADYANCLDIDYYIKSGNGNVKNVVSKIGLWPWKTHELIDLVEWMKDYNEQNPDNILSFIGCDMQSFKTTIEKTDSILAKYGVDIDTEFDGNISDTDFMKLSSADVLKLKSFSNSIKSRAQFLNYPKFEDNDTFVYATLLRHLKQILKEKEEGFFSYRDIKMAENIIYHFDSNTASKGFFWAHNLHVFNIFNEHKKKEKAYKRAGGVLKEKLGDSYFIIAQEFDQGSFNAYRVIDENGDIEDVRNFKLQQNTLEPSVEGSFGEFFRATNQSILFIEPSLLNKKEVKYLKMHDIGSVFNASHKNPNQASRFSSCNGCFDALILIKNTSATQLIE